MMTANGTERAIGQLQGQMEAIAKQQSETDAKVDVLVSHMERQKGGIWVLTGAAGVTGAIAGFVTKWIPHT